jgi:nucleoside-diphosphate-sugar epimerase
LFLDELAGGDRLLVLGAGGWFGQTLLDMVDGQLPVLAVASTARESLIEWDTDAVTRFQPTVVANFAFLTRERLATEGLERFTSVNEELTGRYLHALALPSVRAGLTVSSGAAVTEPDVPYGRLKAQEEKACLALATSGRAVMVARAYSVSGPFVRRPRDYAFSDIILQAAEGQVTISADRPVFRRYVSARDLLDVALALAIRGESGVVESGGPLVEMGELADRVVARVNPAAGVERVPQASDEPSIYASDDVTWSEACRRLSFEPMDLDQQVDAVAEGLLPGRR